MKKQPMNTHKYSTEVDKPSNLDGFDKAIFILAGTGLVTILATVCALFLRAFNWI